MYTCSGRRKRPWLVFEQRGDRYKSLRVCQPVVGDGKAVIGTGVVLVVARGRENEPSSSAALLASWSFERSPARPAVKTITRISRSIATRALQGVHTASIQLGMSRRRLRCCLGERVSLLSFSKPRVEERQTGRERWRGRKNQGEKTTYT